MSENLAFWKACRYGKYQDVLQMLQRPRQKMGFGLGFISFDINWGNVYDGDGGVTPLIVATMHDHARVVELLLQHGADVNKADDLGRTPLILAAIEGYDRIVNLLLQFIDNDINKADNNGNTPLTLASFNGYARVVDILIEHGADINKANKAGNTPLHMASKMGNSRVVSALLRGTNVKVNKANNRGQTPIDVAANPIIRNILREHATEAPDFDVVQTNVQPNIVPAVLVNNSSTTDLPVADFIQPENDATNENIPIAELDDLTHDAHVADAIPINRRYGGKIRKTNKNNKNSKRRKTHKRKTHKRRK